MKFIKIAKDFFKGANFTVKVEVFDTHPKDNEFRCGNCGNIYEKGWSDEEAAKEAQENFGITSGDTLCDDCYNEYMYNRSRPITVPHKELK